MVRVAQGRVTISGALSDGGDHWTTGFAVQPLNSYSDTDLQAIVDGIHSAWISAVWTNVEDRISGATTFEQIRLDDVRNPGGILRSFIAESSPAAAGTSAAAQMPPQCSVVISLLTAQPGGSRRGRMYFPPLAVNQLDDNGRLLDSPRDELADVMQNFFQALNGNAFGYGPVAIASDALQILTDVNRVRVGNVVDTQRRRRDTLTEDFQTLAL